MNCVMSLQRMSSIRMACQIWMSRRLKRRLFCKPLDVDQLESAISELGLPKRKATDLLDNCIGLYEDFQRFLQTETRPTLFYQLQQHLKQMYRDLCRPKLITETLVSQAAGHIEIKLDPCGGLDHAEMATSVLKCPIVDTWKKYVIARRFLLFDADVAKTYQEYVQTIQNCEITTFPADFSAGLRENLKNKQVQILDQLYDFPKSFPHAVILKNVVAMKHFWEDLSSIGQEMVLAELEPLIVLLTCMCDEPETQLAPMVHFMMSKFSKSKGDEVLKLMFGPNSEKDHQWPELLVLPNLTKQFSDLLVWPKEHLFRDVLLRMPKIGLSNLDVNDLILGLIENIVLHRKFPLLPYFVEFWKELAIDSRMGFLSSNSGQMCLDVLRDVCYERCIHVRTILSLFLTDIDKNSTD